MLADAIRRSRRPGRPLDAEGAARRKSLLLLVLTALLWSSSGLFVKVIDWEPLSIIGGRSILATIVLWVYLRRPIFRWSRLQVAGAAAYMGAQIFFVIGNKVTAAANIIFLAYTSSLYLVPLGSWLLKERPARSDWLAMGAIFSGMLLFLGDGLTVSGLRGNLWGAMSGLSMAVMILAMRMNRTREPANIILLGNMMGVLVGVPSLLRETLTLPSVAIILYLGIFQIGLSFVLYSFAIKYLRALESTLILTIEPILNPIWVFAVLGEIPGLMAVLGGLVVLGAVIARALASMRDRTAAVLEAGPP